MENKLWSAEELELIVEYDRYSSLDWLRSNYAFKLIKDLPVVVYRKNPKHQFVEIGEMSLQRFFAMQRCQQTSKFFKQHVEHSLYAFRIPNFKTLEEHQQYLKYCNGRVDATTN